MQENVVSAIPRKPMQKTKSTRPAVRGIPPTHLANNYSESFHRPLVDAVYTTKTSTHTRNISAQQVSASESIVQQRRKLAREAANRHVLAASTIRAWIARTCLARRLYRRKRVRDDLKLRWEPEIQRIAATRIQAVARGAIWRLAWWRAEQAAVDIQRLERGWRGRSAVNALARKRYARRESH